MKRCGDEDYTAARGGCGGGVWVLFDGGHEVGEGCFEGVVGAEDVNVDDGFEGVGGEGGYWREEVACCSGAGR